MSEARAGQPRSARGARREAVPLQGLGTRGTGTGASTTASTCGGSFRTHWHWLLMSYMGWYLCCCYKADVSTTPQTRKRTPKKGPACQDNGLNRFEIKVCMSSSRVSLCILLRVSRHAFAAWHLGREKLCVTRLLIKRLKRASHGPDRH
jgi:hypothetical protein